MSLSDLGDACYIRSGICLLMGGSDAECYNCGIVAGLWSLNEGFKEALSTKKFACTCSRTNDLNTYGLSII